MISACVNEQRQLVANGSQNNSDLRIGKWPLWLANVTCGQSGNIKPQTKVFLDHIPADEGATFLQTVGNHTPNNTT